MCPLRPYRWSITICAVVILLGAVCACTWPSWLPRDSAPEQKLEELIEEETGIMVDLSPNI